MEVLYLFLKLGYSKIRRQLLFPCFTFKWFPERGKKKKRKLLESLINMEEVTRSRESKAGRKTGEEVGMNLFANYFLPNLPLRAVEKEHDLKSLFLLLAEICGTEIQSFYPHAVFLFVQK